ncbi:3',5'-cyclic-nucleotide phosphodiesterase [Colwellia sp. MT41]|uniref:metallophosphoesterase n=1 Tax=Colwellia sp. MT41 TaxID=58049 RepID=UPI000717B698|nr:metallophosphoesterase [Colwellia sp. MT41]ALO35765.1 3',5'-cyclic-nucleotide phosphodiesterase [Colwellia sp. MT41]
MNLTETDSPENKPIVLAQISDSHLFSSVNGLHHGHNVLANLRKVLLSICHNRQIDYVIFTGDLTQDHSEQSYQNFVDLVHECGIAVPIYYLAGNHDEPELLAQYFSAAPFTSDTTIDHPHWQIQLLDSKSATPAGYVAEQALVKLQKAIKADKHQLVMMHHHPIDVGYFIDKYGLQNKSAFWQAIDDFDNIKAIACGHVHSAMQLTKQGKQAVKTVHLAPEKSTPAKAPVTLYTCPATSIQFDPSVDGVAALAKGPGYRIFYLYRNGQLDSDVINL